VNGKLKYYLRAQTGMEDKMLDKVVSRFRLKNVRKNTIILSEGDTCKELYFVHSGCIRTYYITRQGHEKTRYIAPDGTIATSITSFISQQPSFEFVDALEHSELYAISRDDFYVLMREVPQWEQFYRTLLETAYLFQNNKIESLVTLSARQRYEKLLAENPAYVKRFPNKILASYLDISQETLSRLKSK
jgi:CRP-like cAMP-binding protein